MEKLTLTVTDMDNNIVSFAKQNIKNENKKENKYGSLSVKNVCVPEGYEFMVACRWDNSSLLATIPKYWKVDGMFCDGNAFEFACPSTGQYKFDEVDVWIYNQHKHGYIYLYFKNIQDFKLLKQIIKEKENQNQNNKMGNLIYRYGINGWTKCEQYSLKNAELDIFGYDSYIEQIEKDITNHIKYNDFLNSLGEVRSINYLLYGPPGTGKTSMIKAIASKLNCSVFIVNGSSGVSTSVLSPRVNLQPGQCKMKLLLFEDFDRFLVNSNTSAILPSMLNSLDGFDDRGDTVRFFTANNPEGIYKIDALINRISTTFVFTLPTIDIFRGKLERFLSFYENYDNDKKEKFLQLVMNKKITVRPFVNYVIRYLFDENYLDNMIKNIDKLNV